jgi:hypothetical protein
MAGPITVNVEGRGEVNRASLIRELYNNGEGMKRSDIVKELKDKYGQDVSFQVVFQATKRNDRQPAAPKEPKAPREPNGEGQGVGQASATIEYNGETRLRRDVIDELLNQDMSATAISKELGIPYGVVYSQAKRRGKGINTTPRGAKDNGDGPDAAEAAGAFTNETGTEGEGATTDDSLFPGTETEELADATGSLAGSDLVMEVEDDEEELSPEDEEPVL